MNDSLSRVLAELPMAEPDPGRTDRVRSRCHAVLTRHAAHRPARRLWEPVVVGLGGVYLIVILGKALELYGY